MPLQRKFLFPKGFLLLLLLPAVLLGRTWTDIKGNTVEAELNDYRNGMVVLTRADGRTVSIPWERLSRQDQRHITVAMAAREHGEDLIPKLVIGIGFGLVPLIVGSRKNRPGLGFIALLVCATGGGFFGVAGALPACLILLIIVGVMPE